MLACVTAKLIKLGEEFKPVKCGRRDCGYGGRRLNHHGHNGRVDETKDHFTSRLVHCHWGEDGSGKRKDDGKSQTGGMSK